MLNLRKYILIIAIAFFYSFCFSKDIVSLKWLELVPKNAYDFVPETGVTEEMWENEDILKKSRPDFLMLFSWHIKKELKNNLRKKGFKGKFIIPLPNPKIEV